MKILSLTWEKMLLNLILPVNSLSLHVNDLIRVGAWGQETGATVSSPQLLPDVVTRDTLEHTLGTHPTSCNSNHFSPRRLTNVLHNMCYCI